jgi:hypothetical protein
MDRVVLGRLIHCLHQLGQQLLSLSRILPDAEPLDLAREVFHGLLPSRIPLTSLEISA